ncbi:hypothetical protein FA13DRAFT_1741338 [Coprinellus micaceus]|uniref:Uncharacterized protein n=1 Tax=Coprinellus micaceus TaxID=71717 RepID=A0A4Y7SJ84_COPMI|nr:hypothetical protein FA13DRAFT_1741338 [Coprinellus micaceus]
MDGVQFSEDMTATSYRRRPRIDRWSRPGVYSPTLVRRISFAVLSLVVVVGPPNTLVCDRPTLSSSFQPLLQPGFSFISLLLTWNMLQEVWWAI